VVEVVEQLDLSELTRQYAERGSEAHHPSVLLGLLIYGCASGVHSSRKIERATCDSVAFRFVAANTHPDHDTLANFRRRFLKQVQELFVQVLLLAREMKLLKPGHIALDGTKIAANASKHKALSWAHANKIEAQLRQEVQSRLELAERSDAKALPDGLDVPGDVNHCVYTLSRTGMRISGRALPSAPCSPIQHRRTGRHHLQRRAAHRTEVGHAQRVAGKGLVVAAHRVATGAGLDLEAVARGAAQAHDVLAEGVVVAVGDAGFNLLVHLDAGLAEAGAVTAVADELAAAGAFLDVDAFGGDVGAQGVLDDAVAVAAFGQAAVEDDALFGPSAP
jgi:transposase